MTDVPVRVAFIGAGDHMLRSHAQHLALHPDVEIAGCFDPSDASFKAFKAGLGMNGLARYLKLEDLLGDASIPAVMIGSPDKYHLPQLLQAVRAGKHVFCEKPMCSSEGEIADLKNILSEAKAAGLVVTSCHPRRFDPPYVWLRRNMGDLTSRYGKPVELRLDFTYHKPTKTGLHGGSMLQDHMNHEFDYLNFLFGPCSATAHKLLDVEDRYHAAGARDDGIVFSFGGTRRLESLSYSEAIDLRFEHATLHIDTHDQSHSFIHEHEKPGQALLPITPGTTDYEARFKGVNDNWIAAMRGGAANYLTAEEMVANSYMSVAFAGRDTVHCAL